jgi:hypothetical protein
MLQLATFWAFADETGGPVAVGEIELPVPCPNVYVCLTGFDTRNNEPGRTWAIVAFAAFTFVNAERCRVASG